MLAAAGDRGEAREPLPVDIPVQVRSQNSQAPSRRAAQSTSAARLTTRSTALLVLQPWSMALSQRKKKTVHAMPRTLIHIDTYRVEPATKRSIAKGRRSRLAVITRLCHFGKTMGLVSSGSV